MLFSLFKKKSIMPKTDFKVLPRHIAIIMDGNGRWAKKRGLPRTVGHATGSENFRRIATYCNNIGIKYLTIYAFSTENWKRPKDEVDAIMTLLEKYILEAFDSVEKDNIRLCFWGNRDGLPDKVLQLMERVEKKSLMMSGMQVNVCLNYGGRMEIVEAVKHISAEVNNNSISIDDITEDTVSNYLYSAGIPDPELIIRPSGELRISNFLLWQCAYSEFYFTDVLWPDFDKKELDSAILSYQSRSRRFGGV